MGGMPHTLGQVDDDPIPQEGHGQALEQQSALSTQPLAAQHSPHRLLLGFGLLQELCELDGLAAHQCRWPPEQTPSLCGFECLECPQRIDSGLGYAQHFSMVRFTEGIGLGQVLEGWDLERVVVGQHDALPRGLPLPHPRRLPRALCGALALLHVERPCASLRSRRQGLLLHIRIR